MSIISRLFFKMSKSEEAFQEILEESKKNGSLPRISRNGTLHVSAKNFRSSRKTLKVMEQSEANIAN